MYVVVAFDISEERVRGRLRRFLRNNGFSRVNRSVYSAVGGEKLAARVAEEAARIVGERDHVFVITVLEQEYHRAIVVEKDRVERVEDRVFEVL